MLPEDGVFYMSSFLHILEPSKVTETIMDIDIAVAKTKGVIHCIQENTWG